MMWIILILTALLIYATLKYLTTKDLPPGPFSLPILGYLPWLDPKAPYDSLTALSKKYGSIYGLHLGSVYTVVLTDPKDVRTALAKEALTGRAPLYVTHGIMKGYGIICAQGELWRDQRKFIHNCLRQFGATKISPKREKIESIIKGEVDNFLQYVVQKRDPAVFDPEDALRHSVGSVMNQLTFGKTWAIDDETWKWLQHLQEEGTKHIGVSGPLNFLPFLRLVPKLRRTMDFLLEGKIKTHQFYRKLIEEQEKSDSLCENPENLISAFLKERERRRDSPDIDKFYNDQQFYHVLADFFGAGLDTTLTTIRWYVLFMAANPDVQLKVREEIDLVIGGNDVSLDDAKSLPLTEASLMEAQRIRSVVPLGIPHGAMDDCSLGKYRIPKGTMVVPLQWAIHMDPKLWEEPEKFDPWRFLDEEGRLIKPEGFMPFQTGKRMCVGEELAKMLLFLFGATIIQKFTLSIPGKPDLEGDCGITLTPKKQDVIFKANKVH